MTTTRHIARATASADADTPRWQAELRAGAHQLLADEPRANGGGDTGPAPFDFLLSGLVACTAITLRMYADRKDWTLAGIDVDARYHVTDDGIASIDRTITLPADLSTEQRERLADIAERTPVTLVVRRSVPISTTVLVREPRS